MSVREQIEAATTMKELKLIAKQLQLRKVPSGVSAEALRAILLNTVGDGAVYVQPLCQCGHTKKQHYMDNDTGEAFECKVPSCATQCKKYTPKL
jgi:hypothetical protein